MCVTFLTYLFSTLADKAVLYIVSLQFINSQSYFTYLTPLNWLPVCATILSIFSHLFYPYDLWFIDLKYCLSTSSHLIFSFSNGPCPAYLYLWHFLNHTLYPLISLFFFSSFSCPTLSPPYSRFLSVLFFLILFPSPSFPLCSLSPRSSLGSPGPSSAGVFPELRELRAVRPVSCSWDLPHGVDALLVSGPHVGRQLPHCSPPPWGSSCFCLQQDPPPTQH